MEPISWDADGTLVDTYRARVHIVILFCTESTVGRCGQSGLHQTPMTARATTLLTTWRLRTATPLRERRPPGDWLFGSKGASGDGGWRRRPDNHGGGAGVGQRAALAAGHGRRDRVAGGQRHVDTGGGAARRAGHTRQVGVQDEAQRGRKRGALQSTPGGKGLPAAGGRRLHRGLRSSEQARHSASAAGASGAPRHGAAPDGHQDRLPQRPAGGGGVRGAAAWLRRRRRRQSVPPAPRAVRPEAGAARMAQAAGARSLPAWVSRRRAQTLGCTPIWTSRLAASSSSSSCTWTTCSSRRTA